jgi:hypothetical protein
MKFLNPLIFVNLTLAAGCSFSSQNSTSSQSSSESSQTTGGPVNPIWNSASGGSGSGTGQKIFDSSDITYIVFEKPFSLQNDLQSMISKIKAYRSGKTTLVCGQTADIQGLFLCVGNNRQAQHIPLMRPAIFAEGRPSIGVPSAYAVVPQQVAQGAYSKSLGHDVPQFLLQQFFESVRNSCSDLSCLLPGELMFSQRVMGEFQRLAPMGYSVVSFDVESDASIQGALKHEIAHGQFFQQQRYKFAVNMFWNTLSPQLQNAARTFVKLNYDVNLTELVVNEFHAYVVDGTFSRLTPDAVQKSKQFDLEFGSALEILYQQSSFLQLSLKNALMTSGERVWAGSL